MELITGGVTAAKGFKAAAAAAEIKYKGRTDMAMVYSEVPCVAAGTFTDTSEPVIILPLHQTQTSDSYSELPVRQHLLPGCQ